MRAIKIGRNDQRVVFDNTLENWEWLEIKSQYTIDKPNWATTKNAGPFAEGMDEEDAFLFLRQYYKNIIGENDDQATLKALLVLWKQTSDRRFEQHLFRHGIISKDALTSINGNLLYEQAFLSWYNCPPRCIAMTFYRNSDDYRCLVNEWAIENGKEIDHFRWTSMNQGTKLMNSILVISQNAVLEAIKCKRNYVWFEKDIKMLQLDCLYSKQ